ncbi:MAG: uroporphyrinogen-III synthase [Pseudomonadota bacterium]
MTSRTADAPLAGIGVLVTRPREQAGPLVAALAAQGADPVQFPTLAILPPLDPAPLQAGLDRLADMDLAIFISPTAVAHGLAAARTRGPWPSRLPVAAVGAGTARALAAADLPPAMHPTTGEDSEHLLAHLASLPDWQRMAGKQIALFRGETGRETLAEALRAQGAHVHYLPCYRRGRPPQADPAPILEGLTTGRIRAVTAYSAETLDNLLALLGPGAISLLKPIPLFVPHPRIAAHARARGLADTIDCAGGDARLVARIVEYFAHD